MKSLISMGASQMLVRVRIESSYRQGDLDGIIDVAIDKYNSILVSPWRKERLLRPGAERFSTVTP